MSDNSPQILSLLEQGLSPVQVAESLQMDVEVVETIIGEVERKKNAELKKEFHNLQDLAIGGIKKVLQYGENESAIIRAAELVIDVNAGVKDKQKDSTTNIFVVLNERIEAARNKRRELDSIPV